MEALTLASESPTPGSGPEEYQKHPDIHRCMNGVRNARWKPERVPSSDAVPLPRDAHLRLSLNHNEQSLMWRRVLAQALAFRKREGGHGAACCLQQNATDDAPVLKGRQLVEGVNTRRGGHGLGR